jgi:AraC-like DNA-binding protein
MPIPADYRELTSTGLDDRHVEALWSFNASSSGVHIVLPDGRMDLIVRYRLNTSGIIVRMNPAVIGPSQRPSQVFVETGDCFLGLRYRAGRGGACLGVYPPTLRDKSLRGPAVSDILGGDFDLLRKAATPEALKDALIAISDRRAKSVKQQTPTFALDAIDWLHRTGGRLTLPDISTALVVPERTLRRHITRAVGLPYKALAAVLRFQRTMRLLASAPVTQMTLVQAALEGGYSDQAHMTREFRRHGGFTPGTRPPVVLGSLPIGHVAEICKTGTHGTA